ncbi:MAG TPA: hypothetical protein VFF28_04555 [Candidatus Nanoarchaeia archaeon]|nr:hypothetical protein [Candidatus Nanoarchaeia archaeon]
MSYRPITIEKVETLKCLGCFDIYIRGEPSRQATKVKLRNWKITWDLQACSTDSDCIPEPECHPLNCINKKFEGDYKKPEACTEIFMYEAAYKEEDCACISNRCENKIDII